MNVNRLLGPSRYLLNIGLFLGLFDPEDASDVFLSNVG
jgi:hypothetical protein